MNAWRKAATTAAMATLLVRVASAASLADGTFVVSERRSSVLVHVGKSGVLSFAGHPHEVAAPVTGSIAVNPGNIGASSVELAFAATRFRVLPEGEPAGDAPKVEEVMRGPRVLDSARFGEIRFRSRTVSGRAVGGAGAAAGYEVQVTGDLTVRGVTREVVVPMRVVLDGDTLTARGRGTIRHDQFGLTPVTAAGGTVRVRNEIEIGFEIVAERQDGGASAGTARQ
jgi:polyisoprenoid-binding protein YceI